MILTHATGRVDTSLELEDAQWARLIRKNLINR
jgi:hypothetical protein